MSAHDDRLRGEVERLDIDTIVYALCCAANWLDERCPEAIDEDDERGRILRWVRDNPDET